MSREYQPRTTERLIEILEAKDENPRSWQREAAAKLRQLIEHPETQPGPEK